MPRFLPPVFAALLLAAPPLAAQTPSWEILGDATGDELSAALADVGDVDGDGVHDLAVGAPGGGYVRLYSGDDGTQIIRIDAFLGAVRFGTALTSAGDLDDDGIPDLVISAPGTGPGNGKLYVVYSDLGLPAQTITTLSGPGNEWPAAGWSLATAGDIDGDGVTEFLVGAPALADDAPGEVWIVSTHQPVYTKFEGTLEGVADGDRFGYDVATAGDVDGDGTPDILVGTGAGGYARVHSGATLGLLHHFTGPGDDYGSVVSGAGDVNGDGHDDVAVGSPGENFVDIFSGATGALLRRFDALSGRFGSAIVPLGDLDGDFVPDLAVGAPFDDALGVPGSGSAVILSGATGGQLFKFVGQEADAQAGGVLAALGDGTGDGKPELAVGAIGEGMAASPQTGRAALYPSELAGLILPYGFGCPDSFLITPILELVGDPTGGGVLTLSITRGFPGSTAVVFLGTGQGLLPLPSGCILWVDPLLPPVLQLPLGGVFPGTGAAQVTGHLPPGIPPGTVITMQAFEQVLDSPGQVANSGAVQLTLY